MAERTDKKYVVERVSPSGAAGPTGPTGSIGPTGAAGSNSSQVTHNGSERVGETVDDLLDELLYELLTASALAHGLGNQELGSTVVDIPMTWTKNKASVVSQVLAGTAIGSTNVGPTASNYTLSAINLTTSGTWTLTINDGTTIVVLTVTLSFMRKVHWGARNVGTYNDAFILGLEGNGLQQTRDKVFTADAGASEYLYFAQPSSYGAPTFTVGGFEGGFTLIATISHTNASGDTVNYDIWKSDTANLGETTVTVS